MKHPFAWIETIRHHLSEMKMIPIAGNAPHFPLKKFEGHLKSLLHLDSLKIEIGEIQFVPFNDLLSGVGENPVHLPLELSPLRSPFLLLFPKELVKKVTLLSFKNKGDVEHFSDFKLQEGYFRYISLEMIDFLVSEKEFEDLSLHIASSCPLPENGGFCIDITVKINDISYAAKIICPTPFLNEWKRHFSTRTPSLEKLELSLPLSVTIGKTTLTLKELESLQEGDFIFLDESKEEILLAGKPLFKGIREKDKIKIVDYT